MHSVYINYPNPAFSIRHEQSAKSRMRHPESVTRLFQINPQTASEVLTLFIDGEVNFASTSDINDCWLEVDFGDMEFELAVVKFIQTVLGRRYAPLRDAPWLS